MNWVYLSPHLDDVAFSCGGLVYEQTKAGHTASIWTICAGDPPAGSLSSFAESLHERWQTGQNPMNQRRAEDLDSCAQAGALAVHFPTPDCIYRRNPAGDDFLYTSEGAIFGPLNPAEEDLINALSARLARSLPQEVELVCPLALGGHVDHRLTRAAAERLKRVMWYYSDYPYVLQAGDQIAELSRAGWEAVRFPISAAGIKAWQAAVAAHRSQISTFWPSLEAMRQTIQDYSQANQGIYLWQAPEEGI